MCTTAVGGLFGGLEPWRSSSDQVLELYQAVMHLTGRRSVQRPANMQAGRGSRDERQLMPELRKNRLGTEHARDCVDRCVHRSWVGHLRRGGDQHLRCGYPGPGRREFRGHSDHRAGGGDTASAAFSAAGWPDGVGCAALDSGAVHRGRSGGNSRRQQYVGGAFRAAGSGGRLSWCSRNIAVCDHVVRSLRDTCGPNPHQLPHCAWNVHRDRAVECRVLLPSMRPVLLDALTGGRNTRTETAVAVSVPADCVERRRILANVRSRWLPRRCTDRLWRTPSDIVDVRLEREVCVADG